MSEELKKYQIVGFPKTVLSVNGVTPDDSGNVEVEAGGGASSVPDEEMLELLAEMDVVQPLSNTNNDVYIDANNKLYVL